MGYDLHITRKHDWSDEGNLISVEEWQRVVDANVELEPATDNPLTAFFKDFGDDWLTWKRGTIYTKNPSEPMIDKMVEIASPLNARVLGDDGEIYRGAGVVVPPRSPSIWSRIRNWWGNRSLQSASSASVEAPFRVGDRVRDIFGDQNVATVASVDPTPSNGLGTMIVHYDDGRVAKRFCIGHGLELLDDITPERPS